MHALFNLMIEKRMNIVFNSGWKQMYLVLIKRIVSELMD